MIPIHNESGEVVAFSGRLLDPEAKAQKYVNSPETPIFIKSRILFGLNKTKRPIIEADSAILCEGQIDLMRCWQKGIRNVVAPQGTAFTDHHARILKRIAKEVVICFDADRAGQNAAQRTIDVLLKEDLQVRIARIPQGEDPDSLLRKQPVAVFETILREAKDYTRHLLDTACEQEDIASPRGRGAVAQKMAQVIAKIPERRASAKVFSSRSRGGCRSPRSVLEEEVRKAEAQIAAAAQQPPYPPATSARRRRTARRREPSRTEPLAGRQTRSRRCSRFFSTHPELVPQVSRQLNPPGSRVSAARRFFLQLLDAHAHDAWEDAAQFLDECDGPDAGLSDRTPLQPHARRPTETTPEAYADGWCDNSRSAGSSSGSSPSSPSGSEKQSFRGEELTSQNPAELIRSWFKIGRWTTH